MNRWPVRAAAVALVGLLLALLAVRLVSDDRAGALAGEVAEGKEPVAPAFVLPRLDGRGSMSLASLRGKTVMLNFWASWCVPCKQEASQLETVWRRWRRRGVVFLGVDSQDFTTDGRRFVDAHRISYPNLHDGPGGAAEQYGVSGFPETWFVDRRGRLVAEHVSGPLTAARLDRDLRVAVSR